MEEVPVISVCRPEWEDKNWENCPFGGLLLLSLPGFWAAPWCGPTESVVFLFKMQEVRMALAPGEGHYSRPSS